MEPGSRCLRCGLAKRQKSPVNPLSLRGAASWHGPPGFPPQVPWGRGPEDPRRPLYCEKLPAFHLGTSSWAPWERAVPSGAVLPPPGTWLRLPRPAALGPKLRKEQAWLPCPSRPPPPRARGQRAQRRPPSSPAGQAIARAAPPRGPCLGHVVLPHLSPAPGALSFCPLLCRGSPSPCGLYPCSPDHCSYGILQ